MTTKIQLMSVENEFCANDLLGPCLDDAIDDDSYYLRTDLCTTVALITAHLRLLARESSFYVYVQ